MQKRNFCLGLFTFLVALILLPFGMPQAQADPVETTQQAAATAKRENGKVFLYDAAGTKVTGLTGIHEYPQGSGKYYYFRSANGSIYSEQLIKKKGKRYYADENGALAVGWTKVADKTYFFHPKTHLALKGWKFILGKRYYFTAAGVRQTGFQKIGKKTYYLNPADNGARALGWTKVGKKWYLLHLKKGYLLGGIVTDGSTGQKYFITQKGYRKTGLIKFRDALYYFDKADGSSSDGTFIGGAMASGWRKVKKNTYYFGRDGKAVTGWLSLGKRKYYFNNNGVMQTGRVTIGSKVYTFNKTSGALASTEDISGPYSIKVNQNTCVVTIYRGTTPVKAMRCSVGLNNATPDGTFSLSRKIHWQPLFGNCYGQYTSTITGNILFHSVFYYKYKDDHSLATNAYRLLGQPASHGCVRLTAGDAYYIYTNCPNGTKVTIFHGSAKDDPLGKPAHPYPNWTGNYDPTDPIPGD